MRLPVIRQLLNCRPEDLAASLFVLDRACDARGVKEEELDFIGELISNVSGAIEVHRDIDSGESERVALNKFMKKVTSVGK